MNGELDWFKMTIWKAGFFQWLFTVETPSGQILDRDGWVVQSATTRGRASKLAHKMIKAYLYPPTPEREEPGKVCWLPYLSGQPVLTDEFPPPEGGPGPDE